MARAPCPTPHAPCPPPHAPRPMAHDPWPMAHGPCPTPHALSRRQPSPLTSRARLPSQRRHAPCPLRLARRPRCAPTAPTSRDCSSACIRTTSRRSSTCAPSAAASRPSRRGKRPPPSPACVHVACACVACGMCMCACVHVCMCACVHVCMCACVHVCMCMCMCMCMQRTVILRPLVEVSRAVTQISGAAHRHAAGIEARKGHKQACCRHARRRPSHARAWAGRPQAGPGPAAAGAMHTCDVGREGTAGRAGGEGRRAIVHADQQHGGAAAAC